MISLFDQLFVLKEYSLFGHNTARGPLERLARFSERS